MKRILWILAAAAMLSAVFVGTTAAGGPNDQPPGQGPCSHGETGKDCKPDPNPEHGKDCEDHGNYGGVNEDHCKPDGPPPCKENCGPPPCQYHCGPPPDHGECPEGYVESGKDGKVLLCTKEVEKVVYVDRPVDRIVYVDRPVDRVVYVDRVVEKPVDRVVEKTVYVDKPVDRVVYKNRTVTKVKKVVKWKTKVKIKWKTKIIKIKGAHKMCTCGDGYRMYHGKCHPIVPGNG